MQTFTLGIFLEKINTRGEDAHPITEVYRDGSGLLSVFDGLGGAGSTKYELNGELYSGAFFASRITKCILAAYFRQLKNDNTPHDVERSLEELIEIMESLLAHTAFKLDKNPSKLRSRLIKRLPTTLSAIYFEPQGEKDYSLWSINSGDSRTYAMSPQSGLMQISEDDLTNPGDALITLYGDSKISNCVSAEGNIDLKLRKLQIDGPVIFICASDGCFDYIPFPAHFEYMLLQTLSQSSNTLDWQKYLSPKFEAIAADDVTLAVVARGWKDFDSMKDAFSERLTLIKEQYILPINKMEKKVNSIEDPSDELLGERDELRFDLWKEYAKSYESLFPKPKA